MTAFSISRRIEDADECAALASRMAPIARAGDCLLLDGPIGAGKTHFARAFIQARLPEPEEVPSPTYTLVQTYKARDTEIWHCDLYRLNHPDELLELGMDEAFENAICLIEWPDRLGDLTPDSALSLRFSLADRKGARMLTVRTDNRRWAGIREAIS